MFFYPPPGGPTYIPYHGGKTSASTVDHGQEDSPSVTQPPLIYTPITQGFPQSLPLVYVGRGYAGPFGPSLTHSWPPSQYHWPMGLYHPSPVTPVPAAASSIPGVGMVCTSQPPSPPAAWPSAAARQGRGLQRSRTNQTHSRRKPTSLHRAAPTSVITTVPYENGVQGADAEWLLIKEGPLAEQQYMPTEDIPVKEMASKGQKAMAEAAVQLEAAYSAESAVPQALSPKTQQPCAYFLRTGDCIYGDECRFSHPEERKPALNADDLPMRPGATDCKFYAQYKWCAFKKACKFNHPEPLTDENGNCKHTHEGLAVRANCDQGKVKDEDMKAAASIPTGLLTTSNAVQAE